MRFSLIPREMRFFDMFDEAANQLNVASHKFLQMVTVFDNLHERSVDLKNEEDLCDQIVEKIIKALDRTFITPFDREDIHALATSLDDVMDNMEETSHRLEVFRIDRPTPEAIELARIVKDCCGHLEQALKLLRDLRHADKIQHHLREIGRLENEADLLYRKSDAELFASAVASTTPVDILTLIKWRELYGWLEESVDACKDVSQVISEIVIKGT
jgi:predicted phosphate transport protein (TIGR00153 family)